MFQLLSICSVNIYEKYIFEILYYCRGNGNIKKKLKRWQSSIEMQRSFFFDSKYVMGKNNN